MTAIIAASSLLTHQTALAAECYNAPDTLAGNTVVLQVERLSSEAPGLYPAKGVIVQTYGDRQSFSAQTVGAATSSTNEYTYKYHRIGKYKATEIATDTTSGQQFVTQFTFASATSGTWLRKTTTGATELSGHFVLNATAQAPATHFAPSAQNGLTVGLSVLYSHSEALPEGAYPVAGTVILQSYAADGTYIGKGFGPGTVDHFGTYSVTKVAANVVVEQTLQTIPAFGFTAPFTMVYTYNTPFSGTWYQNFGDGLIEFSGTFTTFVTQ